MAPSSTYRLQITPSFTLFDAAAVVPRLADLGVGAVYVSPLLTSTTGSDHGYDWTDPREVDPQRGGEKGWQALLAASRAHGLGVVVDIVPNHMGISKPWENRYWWDVLTHGRRSRYAHWFDIDWSQGPLVNGVLAADATPDDLTLTPDGTELQYYEHRFPVAPGTWTPGDSPRAVHDRQAYVLVPGVEANALLTHRRFFAVSTLAALRVEDPEVFAATHERILRFVHEDGVAGLRVDHPDGLADPQQYFDRLRAAVGPHVWITAEKILEPGEKLQPWPVAGTTGYDAMTEVSQVFVDTASATDVTAGYLARTGDPMSMAQHPVAAKRMVAAELFPAEMTRLISLLDPADDEMAVAALSETAAQLSVYRTYLPDGMVELDHALEAAQISQPRVSDTIAALGPRLRDTGEEAAHRFQQFTGAVMAKGVEDTAYYRANRFVALNEVGGNPDRFGLDPDQFHEAERVRQLHLDESMTSLSTHDTKRSEDVRARLAVLSERTDLLAGFTTALEDAGRLSNPSFVELVAQTLLGTGPIAPERMHDYLTKAMREAHDGTTWMDPNAEFEDAVHALVDRAYDDRGLRAQWDAADAALVQPGRVNSLGQKLVQLTMPGVPDVYQGTEVWDDSLCDPDNRRPVDHAALARMAADLSGPPPVDDTGAAKLWVTRRTLRLRRERPDLFTRYQPVSVLGPAAAHCLAFDRGGAVTIATRLPVGLADAGGWGDTAMLLAGRWRDVLTDREVEGGTVPVATVLDRLPVALLARLDD